MAKKQTRTQKGYEAQKNADLAASKGHGLVQYYNDQLDKLMEPESLPVIAYGEVLPTEETTAAWVITDTLQQDPDTIAVDASTERTDLLLNAGALEIGVDAATSIQAQNSLEKMMAHQMAVCHVNAMKLMTTAMEETSGNSHLQGLAIKKMNLAARLMDSYQKGFETITKARTAGKQTITVKRIEVTGGQNVIADNVTTRGSSGAGEVKQK